jgi:hypothetical protein
MRGSSTRLLIDRSLPKPYPRGGHPEYTQDDPNGSARHILPSVSSVFRGGDVVSSYIELHAASAFSFLQGASLPEIIVDRAAELGYPAIALLDRDGIYGIPRFHKAALAAGIKPIVGAELTIAIAVCRGCGSHDQVAAMHVYRDAPGIVGRCCHCESVLLRIVRAPGRTYIDLAGISSLALPSGA